MKRLRPRRQTQRPEPHENQKPRLRPTQTFKSIFCKTSAHPLGMQLAHCRGLDFRMANDGANTVPGLWFYLLAQCILSNSIPVP